MPVFGQLHNFYGNMLVEGCGLAGHTVLAGFTPGNGFRSQFFQHFGQDLPIVLILIKQIFDLFGQTFVKGRVLIMVHRAMFTDGMFHLARFGLKIPGGTVGLMPRLIK